MSAQGENASLTLDDLHKFILRCEEIGLPGATPLALSGYNQITAVGSETVETAGTLEADRRAGVRNRLLYGGSSKALAADNYHLSEEVWKLEERTKELEGEVARLSEAPWKECCKPRSLNEFEATGKYDLCGVTCLCDQDSVPVEVHAGDDPWADAPDTVFAPATGAKYSLAQHQLNEMSRQL